MKFIDHLCDSLLRALGLAALSPWDNGSSIQQPMAGRLAHSTLKGMSPNTKQSSPIVETGASEEQLGPIFSPPNSSPGFACDYSAMKGWRHTASSGSRNQWLEHPITSGNPTGGVYDIFTDYESFWPIGVTRKYELNLTDSNINADGVNRTAGGKVFNGMYPGPWIEACWGDTLEITVNNFLKYNGTTVHWHGVRQLNSFEMDGVNGVTQCPIATNDSFTYKFNVTQYGIIGTPSQVISLGSVVETRAQNSISVVRLTPNPAYFPVILIPNCASHYSLQYPDGLAGPMTFHGPSSADFDEAIKPFLFSDWSHNSAFEDFNVELHGHNPQMQSVILNGAGFYDCTGKNTTECGESPKTFTQIFQRGRKYLLRLINTSTESTFIFSIDKHMLQVIGADFVAIEPYYTDSVLVGIGQRYHAVVEAKPSNDLIPVEDQNYWIRLVVAQGCGNIEQANQTLGIVRYNGGSTKTPTTKAYQFSTLCSDEPYESLVPVVPWKVSAGSIPANHDGENVRDDYSIGLDQGNETYTPPHGGFNRWDILDTPMWLEFGNPTINHVHDESFYPDEYAIIAENYTKDDWVYIIISMDGRTTRQATRQRLFVPVAHPIHLHGHDFVILSQQNRPFDRLDMTNGTFKYDNPPRRDVALVPSGGYVAIGFKTDNPGIWLLHCHIAWHASSGLALQIRERDPDIQLKQDFVQKKDHVCENWATWYDDHTHWFNATEFQEDSGI